MAINVTVRTAQPLTAGQRSRLLKTLEAKHGRVELNEVRDDRVVGGLSVKVGSTLYDGTVRTKLDQLHELITQ